MAYSTIPKGSLYMNTVLYSGTGSEHTISGVSFQPDWTWLKSRTNGQPHMVSDAVRGGSKQLYPDTNGGETSYSQYLKSFNSDGFVLGTDGGINASGQTYASWNWKAGTAVSGSTSGSGTAKTYTGSVNATAGFSIVKYTGNGTAGHTIPHHLGVAPKMIIVKSTAGSQSWIVLPPTSDGYNKDMKLEDTSALGNSDTWNNTAPTSTVFSVGSNTNMNANDVTLISYSFADVKGYSKMAPYVGNGNADGTFVYTGFKPTWIMIKRTDGSNQWIMLNNKMSLYNNNTGDELYADSSAAQNSFTDGGADFLSNGFKLRGTNASVNGSNMNYIFMAFASNPFVATSGSDAIPVTAR